MKPEDNEMSPKTPAAILACCLLTSAPVASAVEYDGEPLYLGFAIGFPGSDEECDYHGYNCDGSDTGFKFYGGQRFHENLALEISFQDLGKLRDKEGSLTTTADSEGVNFSIIGIIPVTRVGFFLWQSRVHFVRYPLQAHRLWHGGDQRRRKQ